MIALGALLLAAFPEAGQVDSIVTGGDTIFGGFGTFVLAVALIGMVSVITLNLYSGSLAGLSGGRTRVTPDQADAGHSHRGRDHHRGTRDGRQPAAAGGLPAPVQRTSWSC